MSEMQVFDIFQATGELISFPYRLAQWSPLSETADISVRESRYIFTQMKSSVSVGKADYSRLSWKMKYKPFVVYLDWQYICLLCQRIDKMGFNCLTEIPGGDSGQI